VFQDGDTRVMVVVICPYVTGIFLYQPDSFLIEVIEPKADMVVFLCGY
jgi:hypothetical protein